MFDRLRAWFTRAADGAAGEGDCGAGGSVSCEEALASLYEFLDGELDRLTPAEVEEHFRRCAECYPHLSCEKAFRDALRRAGGGPRCPESVRRRILEALERDPASGA